MKTCVTYHMDFKYFDEVDEIRIKFDKMIQIANLRNFLERFKDKTIIIDIDDLDFTEYNDFLDSMIDMEFKNYIIAYPNIFDLDETEAALPHFFDVIIDSWDVVNALCEKAYPPKYILIGNELGFELDKVAKVVHKAGIEIRCIPDRGQSRWSEMPSLKKFFIRPEDLEYYEKYVDAIEFVFDSSIPNVHYEIWMHSKKWYLDINDIIYDYNENTPNAQIIPEFGMVRRSCGKRCIKGDSCTLCDKMVEIAEKMIPLDLAAISDKEDLFTLEDEDLSGDIEIMEEFEDDSDNV